MPTFLGVAVLRLGRKREAEALWEQALTIDPENAQAARFLAQSRAE